MHESAFNEPRKRLHRNLLLSSLKEDKVKEYEEKGLPKT